MCQLKVQHAHVRNAPVTNWLHRLAVPQKFPMVSLRTLGDLRPEVNIQTVLQSFLNEKRYSPYTLQSEVGNDTGWQLTRFAVECTQAGLVFLGTVTVQSGNDTFPVRKRFMLKRTTIGKGLRAIVSPLMNRLYIDLVPNRNTDMTLQAIFVHQIK